MHSGCRGPVALPEELGAGAGRGGGARDVLSGKVSHGVIPGPHLSLAVWGKGLGSGPPLSAPQQHVRAQARGQDQQPLSRLLQAPRGASCFLLPGHCSQTCPAWKNLASAPSSSSSGPSSSHSSHTEPQEDPASVPCSLVWFWALCRSEVLMEGVLT